MFDWIPLGPALLAMTGFAAGLYLACRFAWPRKLYIRIFGGG